MARLLMDGAEGNDLSFWDATTGMTVDGTIKRSGNYSYKMTGGTASKSFPALAELYVRIGAYNEAGSTEFFWLRNGTTEIVTLEYNVLTGILTARVGGTVVGTSIIAMPTLAWNRLEAHLKIDGAAGKFTTKLDGVVIIDFTGDTLVGANASVDNLYLDLGAGDIWYFDDIAINDTTGATHNSWCGDGHIELSHDAGNGDQSDWAGSDGNSVDNYLLVDDVTPDGDATYIEDSTPGNQDMSTVESWDGTYKQVTFAWPEGRARGIVGGEEIELGVKTNSAVHMGGAQALTTQYRRIVGDLMEVNPQSLLPWSEAQINAAQTVAETAAI